MLKVYVGVVRFRDNRDFIILVDGEPQPVEEAVQEVMSEIWGPGEITRLAKGVDFVEYSHSGGPDPNRPEGYVVQCEVGSLKRVNFAIQYARRERHERQLTGDDGPPAGAQ